MQEELNTIFGKDYKVRGFDGGFKVNVPKIDSTQSYQLHELMARQKIRNFHIKRSGTGIVVVIEKL